MTADELSIRQRLKDDFLHYAPRCLKIRTKAGAIEPLVLNSAQQHIHNALETQLRKTGRVRALILKGRQQGCSTYTEGRFYWKVTHRRGVKAFILTHLDDATNNIFGMAKRYHEYCPDLVKPITSASNARELIFNKLESGYKVATAGSQGAGRSDTIQYFHGSEVAFWPHAQSHVEGALQAVPNEPGTEIILESTSAGAQGKFWEMCQAAESGQSQYQLVFVPWFWQQEYREPVPPDFEPTTDEAAYAEEYGLDNEQLQWRRSKVAELGSVEKFRREYPATPEEAFRADVQGALWTRKLIDPYRVTTAPDLQRIVVAIDPAGTHNAKSDETGIGATGLGYDNRAYVLEDVSGRYSPKEWASKAIAVYTRLKADRIVAESNYGGEMVQEVIHSIDPNVPVTLVSATRGKAVRAEPIVGLYEQGRVSHVGTHVTLEDQQCSWIPGKSEYSPDRIDWLVWSITDLIIKHNEPRLRTL